MQARNLKRDSPDAKWRPRDINEMEDLVKQILIEVRNLSYLFFAFGIIWLLLFLYMFSLSRRNRDLQREIDELKRTHTDDHDDD